MEKDFSVKSKVDVLNCMSGNRMTRSKSKVDETVLKRLKITFIKPEDTLLIKDLTINDEHLTNTAQANKDFQMSEQKILEVNIDNDLEVKEDDLQQSERPKNHHTPPHLVYSILPDTPVLDKLYREPFGLPF